MKLTASMLSAISKKCAPVVAKKPIKPILGGVHLRSYLGKIYAEVTNMSDSMRLVFDTVDDYVEAEDIVVQFSDIQALAKLKVDVEFTIEGNSLHVSHKHGDYVLFTAAPEDFPDVPGFEDGMVLNHGIDIREILREVTFSMSKDAFMGNLHGVFFEREGDVLSVVTADGFRLTKCDVPLLQDATFKGGVFLGATFIDAVSKLDVADVVINATSAAATETSAGYTATLISRLPNANFPDYKRVLPQGEPNLTIKFGTEELLQSLEAIMVVKPDNGVKLLVSNSTITFEANGSNGKAKSSCDIVEAKGKTPFMIAISPTFLHEATTRFKTLKSAPTVMSMEFTNETSPVNIQIYDWQHVIMPIRFNA